MSGYMALGAVIRQFHLISLFLLPHTTIGIAHYIYHIILPHIPFICCLYIATARHDDDADVMALLSGGDTKPSRDPYMRPCKSHDDFIAYLIDLKHFCSLAWLPS